MQSLQNFRVQNSVARGRGLYATKPFKLGDVVLSEEPLSRADLSYLNHSCDPNLAKIVENEISTFYAIKDIAEDEELTFSYIGLYAYMKKRHRDMFLQKEHPPISCWCEKCTNEVTTGKEPNGLLRDSIVGYELEAITTGQIRDSFLLGKSLKVAQRKLGIGDVYSYAIARIFIDMFLEAYSMAMRWKMFSPTLEGLGGKCFFQLDAVIFVMHAYWYKVEGRGLQGTKSIAKRNLARYGKMFAAMMALEHFSRSDMMKVSQVISHYAALCYGSNGMLVVEDVMKSDLAQLSAEMGCLSIAETASPGNPEGLRNSKKNRDRKKNTSRDVDKDVAEEKTTRHVNKKDAVEEQFDA